MQPASSVAIVTTVRDPGPSFATWVAYHRRLADRLYIFLDEPANGDRALIPALTGVSVFDGEQASTMSGGNGVMQRQCANADRALALCREDGIDWLLHIDGDELIWSPDLAFGDYLGGLDAGIGSVSFVNHEVVPVAEVGDCFHELHLFKRNGHDGAPGPQPYPFFRFYGNGKSAARVAACGRSDGVHLFAIERGALHLERRVCVLHYACPGYRDWLKKYAQLGDFLAYWWDDPRYPITFRFHLDSRDAYLAARRSGDWDGAAAFYRGTLYDEATLAAMLAGGALFEARPLATLP